MAPSPGVLRIVGRFYSPVLPMLGDNIRNGPTRSLITSTLHSTGLVIMSSSHIAVRPKEIHNIITHTYTHTHFSEQMMFPFPLGSSFRFVRTLSPPCKATWMAVRQKRSCSEARLVGQSLHELASSGSMHRDKSVRLRYPRIFMIYITCGKQK